MTVRILDPNDQTTQGEWRPAVPIPPRVRRFGRYPNVDQWLAGDLLFLEAVTKRLVARLIVRGQLAAGYHEEDARWHHAAVYVGDGFVCEAGIWRVTYRPLHDYIGTRYIRLRRDPTLSMEDRLRLAIAALTRIGNAYSYFELLSVALNIFKGYGKPRGLVLRAFGVICSQLYADSYTAVTHQVLMSGQDRVVIPADLSLTPMLEDVPVFWCRIA